MQPDYNRTHPGTLHRLGRFAELGLQLGDKANVGHMQTLLVVAGMEGANITEIAQKMGRLVMTVSRHIKKLKQPPTGILGGNGRGFVWVSPGTDERVKRVWLTPRGREWVAAAVAILPSVQDLRDDCRDVHGLDSWGGLRGGPLLW